MKTITVLNDKELKQYDEFNNWIEKLKQGFINQKEYGGFPILPECWQEGIEIYNQADSKEKELIMLSIITEFTEALRHWVPEKDKLYPRNRNPYPENDIKHYMKQGWNRFWY